MITWSDFTKFLLDSSHAVGLNDPNLVLLCVGSVFLFLLLIAFSLRAAKARAVPAQRVESLRARVESLEKSLSSFQGELDSRLNEFRSLVQTLEQGIKQEGGTVRSSTEIKAPTLSVQVEDNSLSSLRESNRADQVPVITEEPLRLGMKRTRDGFLSRLKRFFTGRSAGLEESSLYELEELLISSDIGVGCTSKLLASVRSKLADGAELGEGGFLALLKEELNSILQFKDSELSEVLSGGEIGKPKVVLVVGINGVGKTTSCAKLAAAAVKRGQRPLLVAADTFRAAAVEQLKSWGDKLGVPVVSGAPEAKPQTVVFDALDKALKDGHDLILIDTAGRLHTKANLMQELEGIRNILSKKLPGEPRETLLVVDGVSGSNALNQAREFHSLVPLSGLIVTKLDGTPKGGIVVAIRDELKIPVRFVGVGERAEDLIPFSPSKFVDSLVA
jgi:fused signal recognition particle receptor